MDHQQRKKIRLGNEDVDAVVMPFQAGAEHWNEYIVHDGSVIRFKPVVTEILRVEGRVDREGNPLYVVRSTNVLHVSASDRAKRNSDPKTGDQP